MAVVLILILEGLTQAPGFRLFLSFTRTPPPQAALQELLIYLLGLVSKPEGSLRKALEIKPCQQSPK